MKGLRHLDVPLLDQRQIEGDLAARDEDEGVSCRSGGARINFYWLGLDKQPRVC